MVNKILGILGLVLGVLSIINSAVFPSRTVVTAVLAIVSSVLLTWFFIVHFEALKAYSKKRSSHLRINSVLMVAFFLFIVVLLNLIIRQYYFRYDMTSIKKFSLSQQGETVARNLQHDVQIEYFGVEGNMDYKRAEELLEAYRYLNKRIVYELHDLDSSPLLANKYDVKDYGTFVVQSGDRVVKEKGVDEQTMTNLIIRATRKKTLTVRFLQGHGERSINDEQRSGYSVIAGRLRDIGHDVSLMNMISSGGVPVDTDLLVIVSPETEPSNEEYDMLEDYRTRGGKFLVLIDSPPQMKRLINSIGLKTSEFPVYDPINVAGTDPSTPLVQKYYKNRVLGDFNLTTVFPGVYEVRNTRISLKGFNYDFLVRASHDAWFETNGDGIMQKNEISGIQVLAILATHEDELMKIIVFGDSDFASNAYINVGGNADLFLTVCNWLLGEGGLASVSAPKSEFIPMFITVEQARLLKICITVGIPLIIIIAGTVVWYRRRAL